ncbi:SAM-dependent methyltransferase [Halobacteriales archaeon QS_1_68_20]|nr:MAG: SAM-dependent methyltransferase [Halobacteriales archaeon QS_1_68_20]
MPTTQPFVDLAEEYDQWFEANREAYRAEQEALSELVPGDAFGVEIGVGSGRFAAPLDVDVGVDPATPMLDRAADRGVDALLGVGEALPLANDSVDLALLVTTICFLDDVQATLAEARRVLRPDGTLVAGLLDADTPVGRQYEANKDESPFYRDASFATTEDFVAELEATGFTDFEFVQTIFENPAEMEEPDPVREGHGDGLFVGVRATPDE